MKKRNIHDTRGFTLVEVLVVIAIIAVLAGIMVPVVARAKVKSKVAVSRIQMSELSAAIKSYKNDYERFPIPTSSLENSWGDVTFSSDFGSGYENSKLIEILINPEHQRNPKKNTYLRLDESGEYKDAKQAGLSLDGFYLDPFGNEYVITMDKDRDGRCFDEYYAKQTSRALIGLKTTEKSRSGKSGNSYSGEVMIWTAGPDLRWDKNVDKEENDDNILSWN